MKRGSRFFIEISEDKTDGKGADKKGRSLVLLRNRNEKLFHRYYYHARILQLKYELVLAALTQEFDLSECTIVKLIGKNMRRLREISDKKLTRKELKKLYPLFYWDDKIAAQEVVKREFYNKY
jgi:hypothetical protein